MTKINDTIYVDVLFWRRVTVYKENLCEKIINKFLMQYPCLFQGYQIYNWYIHMQSYLVFDFLAREA